MFVVFCKGREIAGPKRARKHPCTRVSTAKSSNWQPAGVGRGRGRNGGLWAECVAVFWVSVLVLGKGDGIADTDLPAAV